MAVSLVTELDQGQTLTGLELVARRRRSVEVDDLLLVARWCELQSTDPRDDPRPQPELPMPPGSDRLVVLGGAGTPRVRELTLAELGIARGVRTLSARAVAADVLDLRFRLPRTWSVFLTGGCDAWVARRVASMTRNLSHDAAAVVDAAVAPVIGSQSPGRVLTLVEAKVIDADTAAHDARVEAERRRRVVSLSRTDEQGLRLVIAKIGAGDAAYVDAVVSRVADILAACPEHTDTPRDELRALAFGWLARPAELLTLLLEHAEDPGDPGQPVEPESELARAVAFPADLLETLRRVDPTKLRPRVVLYVHLHETALTGAVGMARVEGIGPHALAQLKDLLSDTDVTVKPVIDLADRVSVNAYEHRPGSPSASTSSSPAMRSRRPGPSPAASIWTTASPTAPKAHRARPGSTPPSPWAGPGTAPRPTSATERPRL